MKRIKSKEIVKFFLRAYTLLFTLFLISNCHEFGAIESGDPELTMTKGFLFYKGEPFTGKIIQRNVALEEVSISSYKNGLEDGEFITKKNNGQVLEKRYFIKGEKHGIYQSWYPNGNHRGYYEFNMGKYTNDNWSWYEDGKPAKYEKFDANGNILVTKVWNRFGKIYMNLSFKPDGSSIGLPGSKICEPITGKQK